MAEENKPQEKIMKKKASKEKKEKNSEEKKTAEAENKNDEIKEEMKIEKSELKETAKNEEDGKNKKKIDEEKKSEAKPVAKKTEAIVKGNNLHISQKHAIAICNYIKGKGIDQAIRDLEEVIKKKKPIPMKGEIPHRHGKIMSGRYPINASKDFVKLLKSLSANARMHGLDEHISISSAKSNVAARPHGRFGRYRRKRTHVEIRVHLEEKSNKGAKK